MSTRRDNTIKEVLPGVTWTIDPLLEDDTEESTRGKMVKVDKSLRQYIPPLEVLRSEIHHQAYRPEIAEWALEHQRFGGPAWRPARMTWIKPSFGWMLYRSGYGQKGGQKRVLKVKLSHSTIAHLLSHCKCVDTNRDTRKNNRQSTREGGRGNVGRVQWDPERDMFQPEQNRKEPRRMLRRRAIQIGLAGSLSEYYVNNIVSIEEVTDLARGVGMAHKLKKAKDVEAAMDMLRPSLPNEEPYLPQLPDEKLKELGMLPGPTAKVVAQLGRGRASESN